MPGRTDIDPLSITDGKISNQAKISHSKLATASEGQVLVAQSDGKFAAKTLSGDVTVAASGATTSNTVTTTDGTTVVTGSQGPKGDKGATGDQGSPGPSGSDATVTTNAVDSAGAVMHTDFTNNGFIKRDNLGSYSFDTSAYSTTDHDHTLADISDSGGAAALDVWAGVGDTENTVCAGGDSRLADTRNPNSHKASHSTGGTDVLSPSDIGASADDHTHGYSSLTGIPTAFAPSSHNHDHNALTNYAVGQHRVINDDLSSPSSTELWSASNISYQLGNKEPSIGTKNTAFNKNFGTTTGTVCQGGDSRLSDARTPSSTLTHKATHATGGADALTPADIGASADDHTHSAATTSSAGFMSSGDKTTLDGLVSNVQSDWNASSGLAEILNRPNVQYTSAIALGNNGLIPAAGNAGEFLSHNGTFQTPAGNIDWTANQGSTNINTGNYTNTTYTADDGIGLSGTVFSVAAGNGLTQDSTGLSLNLQGVTEEAVRVDEDYLVFLDGGSTGAAKKESIEDLATAMAGAGLTASSGELRIDFKYARSIEWATTQSNVSYNVGNTIATLTHNLGSSYVMVSVKDVDGVLHNSNASSTGGYLLDLDYDALIKVVDSNNISIEFDITTTEMDAIITNNNEFQVTVIG